MNTHSRGTRPQEESVCGVTLDSLPLDSVPQDVLDLMERLHERGRHAWIVGGAVRDLLRNVTPKDWDVATKASLDEIFRLFPRVVPLGIRHGTLQVHTPQRQVEVTSLATTAGGSILNDLGRRDFTINAMALDYPSGNLLDPHRGKADLRKGRIRAVGDPHMRLQEDPLRMVRAARFMSTLGFGIESGTRTASRLHAAELHRVAQERIREELFQTIEGFHVFRAFEFMRTSGVLVQVLPELWREKPGVSPGRSLHRLYRHSVRTAARCPPRRRIRIAALLHCLGASCLVAGPRKASGGKEEVPTIVPAALAVMKRWKMAHKEVKEILTLLTHQIPFGSEDLSDIALRRLVLGVGTGLVDDLLQLGTADRMDEGNKQALDAFGHLAYRVKRQILEGLVVRKSDLEVSGKDVMEILGIAPGPEIGRVLDVLHNFVLENPQANRRDILLWRMRTAFLATPV